MKARRLPGDGKALAKRGSPAEADAKRLSWEYGDAELAWLEAVEGGLDRRAFLLGGGGWHPGRLCTAS